ncbi:4-alpha-glucanotransferase [Streptomyces lonarensis]|uniref:4-alpha-glucanotransferase n=1 Tax=Streptomyces lonarensis TaxID=700599 RepID=A0A7X6D523_9ACTN|nr:4-alpha-glucanotransferase [Streptomyces lonarensis]NJQ08331.1 4-alpha-glucanotransferase [Streptomyces lonarensis]
MRQLARLAAAHSVATSYRPSPDRCVDVPRETVVAVLGALGVDATSDRAIGEELERHHRTAATRLLPPTVVLGDGPTAHEGLPPLPEGTVLRVRTEDGRELGFGPGLPLGRHLLRAHTADGRSAHAHLLVTPDRLPVPRSRRHGLLLQLYSVLSARSWGMGDLSDLAELAGWSGRAIGAGFLQINPLHAAVPAAAGEDTDPSPYRPATRRYCDPVHLRVEDVPEFRYLDGAAAERAAVLVARAGELRDGVLRHDRPIDRDAVWALKREALELVHRVPLTPGRAAAHAAYRDGQGRALADHALWCALTERHGPDWRGWPAGLRDPASADTARARDEHRARVDFHAWLTWLTDEQLATAQRTARAAGMDIGLVHDLALGVHPDGSEAWAHQGALAAGMSIGAPPDAFNARGQDWGLPPWRPDALAAAGYAPYRELLDGLLRHAGGLRIDHVLSHFRLWWVPEGASPADGTYVHYDARAMLGTLALAAQRSGAVVIGEDLGTVEPGVREELSGRGLLGTSVLWFEREYDKPGEPALPPWRWRAGALATVSTHDLPPAAARLGESDIELRLRLGLVEGDPETARAAARAETEDWLATFARHGLLSQDAGEEDRITAAYRYLARTPARLIGLWLPDLVGDRRPQNVPGTWREYPNWRLPVSDADGRPLALEQLVASPRLAALTAAVRAELDGRG